jgi:hypothetical protein
MEHDTPKTNRAAFAYCHGDSTDLVVTTDFAGDLERENTRLREALLRIRTWGIRAHNFDAQDNRAMADWVDAGCAGPLPTPDGPWIYSAMANAGSEPPRSNT